ncbi:hypothetical protein LINPERHAP1_LOCUS20481 [Linum perenne]
MLNVDGATTISMGDTLGLVVPDCFLAILFVTSISIIMVLLLLALEIFTFRDACVMCSVRGWSNVDIECDATLVVTMVSNHDVFSSQGGIIVSDIVSFLRASLSIRPVTVPRMVNRAAHYVTRQVLKCLPNRKLNFWLF